MSKEIPILFSTPMVQAILKGQKTQTRRVVKPQPIDNTEVDGNFFHGGNKGFVKVDGHSGWKKQFTDEFCKYNQGDLLWVRETHTIFEPEHCEGMKDRFCYKASFDESNEEWRQEMIKEGYFYQWKPSIFMKKEACRIWLEVTDVRIERLKNISGEDILNEGVRVPVSDTGGILFGLGKENNAIQFMPEDWKSDRRQYGKWEPKYVHSDKDFLFAFFAELWCDINGSESWDSNPWVWVVEFKVLSTKGKP